MGFIFPRKKLSFGFFQKFLADEEISHTSNTTIFQSRRRVLGNPL